MNPSTAIPSRRVIGGELELARLPWGSPSALTALTQGLAGTWTASGRSALALVLNALKAEGVTHVHLPAYLCDSVVQPVRALGLQYSFYPVDRDLKALADPPKNAAVVLIHYFGWLNAATETLRREAGRSLWLIEDASQALLSDWKAPQHAGQFVILSPRKFAPVPLGGWCSRKFALPKLAEHLEGLAWRALAGRLIRSSYLADAAAPIMPEVEDFYLAAFQAVERFLDADPTCSSVPDFVLNMIAGLDWPQIKAQRRHNWRALTDALAGSVELIFSALPDGVVPLGLPVRLTDRDRIRAKLRAQRMFCPVHWPLPAEVERRSFPEAHALAESCLTLPLDQRYGPQQMTELAGGLLAFL